MKATAKDLRFHVKELLDAVRRGEEVIISYRGKPCAKLVPLEASQGFELSQEPPALFGIWQDNEAVDDVTSYVDELRRRRY
jgi:prevent-host-death family protein